MLVSLFCNITNAICGKFFEFRTKSDVNSILFDKKKKKLFVKQGKTITQRQLNFIMKNTL